MCRFDSCVYLDLLFWGFNNRILLIFVYSLSFVSQILFKFTSRSRKFAQMKTSPLLIKKGYDTPILTWELEFSRIFDKNRVILNPDPQETPTNWIKKIRRDKLKDKSLVIYSIVLGLLFFSFALGFDLVQSLDYLE